MTQLDDVAPPAGSGRGEDFAAALVDADDPGDALARYYFCFHPRGRRRLVTSAGAAGRAVAVRADTDHDDTPLVVIRAATPEAFMSVLRDICEPGLQYLFITRAADARLLQDAVTERRHEQTNIVCSVTAETFRDSPYERCWRYERGDLFGYRVYAGDVPVSSCSLIWASDRFAEVAVATRDDYRGRGFGKAAVAAMTRSVLASGVRPLYVVSEQNVPSLRLAEALGYRPTGAIEFSCYGTMV